MAEEAATGRDDGHFMGPSKNLREECISSGQRQCKQNKSKSAAIKLTSTQLGLGEVTMWSIIKLMKPTGTVASPPKTISNTDDIMPEIKRTTLWKIMMKLDFKWEKQLK
ncbi:hypothetical protein Trydic_g2546 [Trypoxylus dichotomus]